MAVSNETANEIAHSNTATHEQPVANAASISDPSLEIDVWLRLATWKQYGHILTNASVQARKAILPTEKDNPRTCTNAFVRFATDLTDTVKECCVSNLVCFQLSL